MKYKDGLTGYSIKIKIKIKLVQLALGYIWGPSVLALIFSD